MKPSHLHAPRTLAACVWQPGPVERYDGRTLRAAVSRWLRRWFGSKGSL